MFDLPSNIRLPGFRVGLPDDPSDQDTGTAPGFAVPAGGYDLTATRSKPHRPPAPPASIRKDSFR